MDTQRIRCLVLVHSVACGWEELPEKRRAVGVRPGHRGPAIHHECGEHKFHTYRDSEEWALCDCLREEE